jgi:hypothetical protein
MLWETGVQFSARAEIYDIAKTFRPLLKHHNGARGSVPEDKTDGAWS